jgi:hypothetical protein
VSNLLSEADRHLLGPKLPHIDADREQPFLADRSIQLVVMTVLVGRENQRYASVCNCGDGSLSGACVIYRLGAACGRRIGRWARWGYRPPRIYYNNTGDRRPQHGRRGSPGRPPTRWHDRKQFGANAGPPDSRPFRDSAGRDAKPDHASKSSWRGDGGRFGGDSASGFGSVLSRGATRNRRADRYLAQCAGWVRAGLRRRRDVITAS